MTYFRLVSIKADNLTAYAAALSAYTIRLLLGAMAIMIAGIVLKFQAPLLDPNPEGQIVRGFLLVTAVFIAFGMFLGASLLNSKMKKFTTETTVLEKLKTFRKGMLLQFGLMSLGAYSGAIGFLLTQHYMCAVLAAMVMAVMVAKRPRRTLVMEQLQLSESEIDTALMD